MQVVIYHGKRGTGKTTLLTAHAINGNTFAEAQQTVAARQVFQYKDGHSKCLIIDECTLDDLDMVQEQEIDTLFLSFQQLPPTEQILSKFNNAVIDDIRETFFPHCLYIAREYGFYTAHFGGYSESDDTYDDLIKWITRPDEIKEVTIPDVEQFKAFLDKHKEPPTNFFEWGLDYAAIMRIADKLGQSSDAIINLTKEEICALWNYNELEIQWIEDLYLKMSQDALDDLPF